MLLISGCCALRPTLLSLRCCCMSEHELGNVDKKSAGHAARIRKWCVYNGVGICRNVLVRRRRAAAAAAARPAATMPAPPPTAHAAIVPAAYLPPALIHLQLRLALRPHS